MKTQLKFNLFLRQIIKIAALFAMAFWAWELPYEAIHGAVRVLGLIILALVLWGFFIVPNDPFHSSSPMVAVNGKVRILIECVFFGFAIFCLYDSGLSRWSWMYSNLVLLHFAFSHQRLAFLIKAKK